MYTLCSGLREAPERVKGGSMKRAAAALILIVLTAPLLWSQNVAEEEITGVEPGSVEFLNYEGPHEEVQSAGEIRGIGSVLALPDAQPGAESAYFDKYRFLHIIGEGEPEKFHADSNGSMPEFDEEGKVTGMARGEIRSLFRTVAELARKDVLSLSNALKLVTENPARRLGVFDRRGGLTEGKDADILVLSGELELEKVFAGGELLLEGEKTLAGGPFE